MTTRLPLCGDPTCAYCAPTAASACGALYDGIEREAAAGAVVFTCTRPSGHAGSHADAISDAPAVLTWEVD